MTDREAANAFLAFFKDRFYGKINPEEYALAYSGGKDSHLLYWIIKEYLHEERVVIVGVNTSFEIPQIRDRILKNCDVVLHPALHRNEIKEKYGIPCFSKNQDDYIYRYQSGNRSENTMKVVMGTNPIFKLNKTARTLLLNDELHKVSSKCCNYNKELPMKRWARENNKKIILAVRRDESMMRKSSYKSCMKKNGDFTPMYDWTNEMVDLMYRVFDIEIPSVYDYVERTGCAGCPYGRHTETELALLPRLQRQASIDFFKESYDVLGVDYQNIQAIDYDGNKEELK